MEGERRVEPERVLPLGLRLGKAALLPPHANADEAYYRAQIPVVDRRLAEAGVRLAAALNEVLTSPPPEW